MFCSVYIEAAQGTLAVEVPPTAPYGVPVWHLGSVPEGGVADSWYDDDRQGSFRVRNAGDVAAYIWITAEQDRGDSPLNGYGGMAPTNCLPSPDHERFSLAMATNCTDLLPAWELLDTQIDYERTGRLLGWARPGEYLLFDLKFYAPLNGTAMQTNLFNVGFYAIEEENPDPFPPNF
jgi:hypothetical protein